MSAAPDTCTSPSSGPPASGVSDASRSAMERVASFTMRVCSVCGGRSDGRFCPNDGTPLEAPATVIDELAPGTMVGEYRIERRIGSGGMGIVYGAKHPVIGKRAAIKVLNARYTADREAIDRFVVEAQAVNQVGHANIVDIFSFGTLPDGRSYFIMEWLAGETLGQRIARGQIPAPETIAILVPLCHALEAA